MAKLTKPQLLMLQKSADTTQYLASGGDTRVARKLKEFGFGQIVSPGYSFTEYFTINEAGLKYLTNKRPKDKENA